MPTPGIQAPNEEFLQLNKVGSPDGGTGLEDGGFEPPARMDFVSSPNGYRSTWYLSY